jgi:D-alanyl-lipoteichoic acid acyltransferase DltB (MBOAT superfamily)
MSLIQIIAFFILAIFIGLLTRERARLWAIYLLSLLSVFIFQPLVPLRNFDFWLPTVSIVLTIAAWVLVRGRGGLTDRENIFAALASILVVAIIFISRFLPFEIPWMPSSLPPLGQMLIFTALTILLSGVLVLAGDRGKIGSWFFVLLLLGIFILLKTETISIWISERLRVWQGQSVELASTSDLNWLGFSYVSFRLIHTLRDHQSGRLPETNLREFVTYVLFFPALIAGPIDRIERFVKDLDATERMGGDGFLGAAQRISIGLFKKFVLADGLALMALNATNAALVSSQGWTLVLLYSYAFRLYFDFSGYTDVAIGLGLLVGVELPENFQQPYRKASITAFWNSWHITLARWFRSYFFNPLTRWLRSDLLRNSPGLIILIGQTSTMLLIGLWHGISWNFAIWGLWHGVGLFIHNRWVDYLRRSGKPAFIDRLPDGVAQVVGVLVTFHFTTVGWVWFALPNAGLSIRVLRTLLGF